MDVSGRALSGALLLVCLSAPCAAGATPAPAPPATNRVPAEDRLVQIIAGDARRRADLEPLAALYAGQDADPQALEALFTDGLDRKRLDAARTTLAQLESLDTADLSAAARISRDVLVFQNRRLEAALQPDMRRLTGVRPLSPFAGFHTEFPALIASGGVLAYADASDYARGLAYQRAYATVLGNAQIRFRQGMASGLVEPRDSVRTMIAQIDAELARPVEDSAFYSPVRAFPPQMGPAQRSQWQQAYRTSITDTVRPSLRALRSFLQDSYLPRATQAAGLGALPGGDALYREAILDETTLPFDPDAIHAIGLREVARIRDAMQGVQARLGFTGTLEALFDHIRADPRFHPASEDDLARAYTEIAEKVARQVPRFFSTTPRSALAIEPYPASRGEFAPGASYYQGSPDGSRPGVFYYNTYDLPSRTLTGTTTLYLHEGVPGHHFQISLAQENPSLPDFQRYSGNSAFIEGWALYAETLGYAMGLYDDPLQHWGTLDDEMLRAMRLVVDTGIHAQGWSRERAIAYMLANSGMSRTDATQEVDRYIALPAQALSYKIGAMTIQRLRREAESALGARFDIRAFHEQVLASGALPLPVLEAKVRRWIADGGG